MCERLQDVLVKDSWWQAIRVQSSAGIAAVDCGLWRQQLLLHLTVPAGADHKLAHLL